MNAQALAVLIPMVLRFWRPLEVNPAAENEGKRSHCDEEPEKDTLKQRSNANFAESLHGKPRPNQIERDSQADNAKLLQHRIRGLEDANAGIGDRRHTEKENEPCPLDMRLALVSPCGPTEWGTIHRARANLTVVPTARATAPYFAVAPTTELMS